MLRVVRTDRAELDLIDILEYLGENSTRAMNRFVAALERACSIHAQFPRLGTPCEGLAPGLRRFIVEKYAIFFQPIQDGIEIVRVLHGARDFPSVFHPGNQPPTDVDEGEGE